MKIQVTIDGTTVDHDIEFDVGLLDLQVLCRLEESFGTPEEFDRLMDGDEILARRPSTIRRMIFCQLGDKFPDLALTDFTLNMEAIDVGELESVTRQEVVDLPMQLQDGSTVEGASDHVDPTKGAATG